jgi:hypothetical protein
MPRLWAYFDSARHSPTRDQVALFRDLVIRPESVLYAGAGAASNRNIADFLSRVAADTAAIRLVAGQLASELPAVMRAFADSFPDFHFGGTIYIYPSLYNRNGGVFEVAGRRVLGFGPDMIVRVSGADASLRVLVSHELFHLYHYAINPRFAEQQPLWGQIWREGLATYVSSRLTGTTSEAALLSDSTLSARVRSVLPALLEDVRQHLDDTARAVTQPYMQSRQLRPDIPPRAGYYIGYVIARRIGGDKSLAQLARMGGDSLRARVRAEIDRM